MKLWAVALCLLAACASAHAQTKTKTEVWQPGAGLSQMPLWPGTPPDAKPMPGPEFAKVSTGKIAGKTATSVSNVSTPTLTVYAPKGNNTGAAVLVIPGGGFQILAMDLEGTEICDWLTSRGITCVLVKYRVPSEPYDWHCDCRPHNLELSIQALDDTQRAVRLTRFHAAQWHVDPHRIGVVGFSAGGYLVAELSTNFNRRGYAPVDAADKLSSRPDFAMGIYPGHLVEDDLVFNHNIKVTHDTPPTFLVQAEDDHVDGVNQALFYFTALKNADVPAELHIYAHGGHAFGVRRTVNPITRWTALADEWMRTIGVVPAAGQ